MANLKKDTYFVNSKNEVFFLEKGTPSSFIQSDFKEIKESEVVVMLDMIEKLYKRFGISKNTKISSLEKLENTDYPIFSDLQMISTNFVTLLRSKSPVSIDTYKSLRSSVISFLYIP